ncbi:MAG: hypothetical protein ABFQ53_00815 [Patescibacteria group bacterium]
MFLEIVRTVYVSWAIALGLALVYVPIVVFFASRWAPLDFGVSFKLFFNACFIFYIFLKTVRCLIYEEKCKKGLSLEEFCEIFEGYKLENMQSIYDARKKVAGYVTREWATLTFKTIQSQNEKTEW